MKVRTFLFLLVTLALVFAITSLFQDNRALLRQRLELWGGSSVPIGTALLFAFVVGGAVISALGLSRELGRMLDHWRLRRASRRSEEIEEEYARGIVALVEGREDDALGHFRAVLERDSRHFNTLLKIGEVLRSQENWSEAIEFHRKAHHIKEEATQPLYALVEDYEAKGDLQQALLVMGKLIALNKNSIAAWRKLRALHIGGKQWPRALEAHQRVERLSPAADARDRRFGAGIRYEMAAASLEEGKPRDAIAALRKLVKDHDAFIPAHVKLGEALRQDGQEAEAVQAWFSGFEATGSPIFLTVLEEHYLQREQPLAAIEALKQCVAGARKDTLPRFYLGKLYVRLEMLDDALAVLTSLEGRASYAPTLHYLLGRIHERRNNHRAAVQEYRRVIRELELVQLEYICRACGETIMEWSGRCAACGEWNTIEVNFREEITFEELGLAPAPMFGSGRDG